MRMIVIAALILFAGTAVNATDDVGPQIMRDKMQELEARVASLEIQVNTQGRQLMEWTNSSVSFAKVTFDAIAELRVIVRGHEEQLKGAK